MTDAPYTPRPGTYGAKALAWLREQPLGTIARSITLARAIGMPATCTTGTSNITRYLQPLVDAGLIVRHGAGGPRRLRGWSLPGAELVDPDSVDTWPIRRSAPEIQPQPGPFLPGVKVGEGARRIASASVHWAAP